MTERAAVGRPGFPQNILSDSNPVYSYGMATLIVFGSLYVLQSFGMPLAWPIALVVGLGLLVLCKGQDCPTFVAEFLNRQKAKARN